jgi:hypothetical protein
MSFFKGDFLFIAYALFFGAAALEWLSHDQTNGGPNQQ